MTIPSMKTGLSHGRKDKIPISSIEKAFFKIELRRWDKNMVQVRHETAQVRHEMAQVRYVSGAGAIFSC